MKHAKLISMTTQDLVRLFTQIAVAQDDALLGGQIAEFNRLYGRMKEISDELKGRAGDQRRALMALYEHPNMQVRLKAAIHTLAVAPGEARQAIEIIASSKWFPQAGDAGMCLLGLDEGTFKPT